jgi:hypothetical protein
MFECPRSDSTFMSNWYSKSLFDERKISYWILLERKSSGQFSNEFEMNSKTTITQLKQHNLKNTVKFNKPFFY